LIGEIKFPNGDIYKGYIDIISKKGHGIGTYFYKDGSRYEGNFIHGAFSGNGEVLYNNGDRYVGGFQNG
jgi:hypothetical protein